MKYKKHKRTAKQTGLLSLASFCLHVYAVSAAILPLNILSVSHRKI